jgi:Shikimate kinase
MTRFCKGTLIPVATDKIISLIGMPGSGKSTIGTALAARLDLELVDADGLIEAQEGHSLQEIMDGRGNAAFRAIEEPGIN